VATLFPSACWFEREITDGFGVTFPDSFDKRHLFLHEVYPEGFHPLRKDFRNQPVITSEIIPVDNEYVFKKVTGEGVYQIPVGPVHAGIIEPGHFRFSVIGETIFNLENQDVLQAPRHRETGRRENPTAGGTNRRVHQRRRIGS